MSVEQIHRLATCPRVKQGERGRGGRVNVTQGTILRLLPPLILSDEQADAIVDQVVELING